jgi:hypothetical protein
MMRKANELDTDKALKQQFQAEQLRKEAGMPESSTKNEDVEYAAELTPSVQQVPSVAMPPPHFTHLRNEHETESIDPVTIATAAPPRTFGYFAIIVAILSLFVWPVMFGPAAAILGLIAYMRGSKALGAWSIVLGILAIGAYFILLPFYS